MSRHGPMRRARLAHMALPRTLRGALWADEVWDTAGDHRVEIEEIIEAGDGETVVMLLRSRGRWKHMDLDFEVPWAAVWRICAGKLTYGHGYLSKEEALEAAGLSE